MILVLSGLLALISLIGVAFIVLRGSPFTVDGLFMSLILLAMSAVFGGMSLFELKKGGAKPGTQSARAQSAAFSSAGGVVHRGRVRSVQFFESNVGEPNKSIVTLANGGDPSRTLVLEGDMRNALPVGLQVEVTFRKASGQNVLVNVNYS